MTRPTFLFIGPDKAGSKWLHEILLRHPDCFVPEIADPYFFDRHYDRGLEWYLRLFHTAPASAKAIGELSHDYLFSTPAADRIRKDLPDVQLLTCLRDPAERTFSQYLSMIRAGQTRETFEQALDHIPRLIDNSRYTTHLERYLSRFPRAQLHILWYDQLAADPRAFASAVFNTLGVRFISDLPYDERVNPAGTLRNYYLSRAIQTGVSLVRALGLPQVVGVAKRSFLRSVVYRPYAPGERPRLSAATRQRIVDQLEPEMVRLERLLTVDLSPWRRGESLWTAGTRPNAQG